MEREASRQAGNASRGRGDRRVDVVGIREVDDGLLLASGRVEDRSGAAGAARRGLPADVVVDPSHRHVIRETGSDLSG